MIAVELKQNYHLRKKKFKVTIKKVPKNHLFSDRERGTSKLLCRVDIGAMDSMF